jgi:Transposase domain (DUF772)
MRPKKHEATGEGDLFRARLDQIINLKHELVQLGGKIDWAWLDEEMAPLYSDKGRPGIESRFVIGLLLLKHMFGLSDEGVCERWVYDPYFQHFTGETFFQHTFPHERSDLSHWRKRLGDKLDLLLAERGKARAPYEFGVKVSIVTTNACAPGGQFVMQAKALPGNPYDGHTLRTAIEDTQRLTGRQIERAYVDKGYRGHDAPKPRKVFISGQKRGVFGIIKRELRRRSAIEPLIGHMKEEGHLGRCYLKGHAGDAANAILTAAGYNFRRILAWLRSLLRLILSALIAALPPQPALNPAS